MRRNSSQGLSTLILLGLAGGLVVAAQALGEWTAYGFLAALGIIVVLGRWYTLARRRIRSLTPSAAGALSTPADPSPKAAPATFADPRSAAAEAFGAAPRRRRGADRR